MIRRVTASILLGSVLFFFLIGSLRAAEKAAPQNRPDSDLITARAEAGKGTATIGEPIEYRITVKYKKQVEILSALSSPKMAGLEIKKTNDFQDREDGFQIMGKALTLTAYQLGNYLIEPVEISYRIKGGGVQTLRTNPVYISVKSVAEGEEKQDIRDIKGVVKLPYRLKMLLFVVLTIALLGILLAAYLLYFRKKESDQNARKERLTPAQQALQDLQELFESTLIRDGRIKQYYLRFSEILKIYLEKQFGIQAAEATTSEIARLLKRIQIAEDAKKHLMDVLESSDFAKFAKWVPSPLDIAALNRQAEAVVIELSERPTQPENESHAIS